jgi:UDP-GlcNAc3NAcA epimerase
VSGRIIATIVGARPQFIKAAPVSRALTTHFREILIHTGQHYDYGMSEVFFTEMQMKAPDFNLGVGGGTHGEQTAKMLVELENIFVASKPDCILVYGDTNSTLAGSLAASKLNIRLAHVEAGLRSYNRAMPEEINRVLTDHVSDMLFCPTDRAVENLKKEGITTGVHRVGDVMYDALLHNLKAARERSRMPSQLGLKKGEYALATVHRAANTDDPERMRSILAGLSTLSTQVVFPVHPRAHKMMQEWKLSPGSNVKMIEPLGPFDMLTLQENSNCILTDSGGVQKEAYLLGVRCITLREETEWVETVEAGWNRLVAVDQNAIRECFESWHPSGPRLPLYGDGNASLEIVSILKQALAL